MDNIAATNRMAKLFIATGFAYFSAATLLLALNISRLIAVQNDPIFVMDLYGFVAMLIFGLSYIFVPGLSHTRFAWYRSIEAEYVIMNIGVIATVLPLLARAFVPVSVAGVALLLLAVLMHAINVFRIMA
ncbi:MAG: hypothetical protein QXR58_01695, partial [Candidatus Micrarchaeaceae archaeon]